MTSPEHALESFPVRIPVIIDNMAGEVVEDLFDHDVVAVRKVENRVGAVDRSFDPCVAVPDPLHVASGAQGRAVHNPDVFVAGSLEPLSCLHGSLVTVSQLLGALLLWL